MNKAQAWASDFGDAYTIRNRVQWEKRQPFWEYIINKTEPASVLEVGCNSGWNMRAISSLGKHSRRLTGVDVNKTAIAEAQLACFDVRECAARDLRTIFEPGEFDLVYTCGVLIHIPPEDLTDVMQSIVDVSRKYVLAVEYAHKDETPVEYRGHTDMLWKRPYGRLYEHLGLKTTWFGFLAPDTGFDQCTAWLMEKV